MKRSPRRSQRIRGTWHRPRLERLEPRLPPGDAMLGLLLAWPDLPIETSELNDDIGSTLDSSDLRAAGFIPAVYTAGINPAPRYTTSSAAEESTSDVRAAGLIPAVFPAAHTAGINPAARYPVSSTAEVSTSGQRAAGLIPAVYPAAHTAGINPAARYTGGALANHVPAPPTPTQSPNGDIFTHAQHSKASNDYGKLPLTFEANHGQTDARVDFITRAGGSTVYLTSTAAVFSIQNSVSEPEALATVADLATRPGLASVAYASGSESAGVAIHMQLIGANPDAEPVAQQRQPGIVNYFIGNDPSQWHANIPTFGRVQYDDVYPGIDLAYYGNNGHLEYDFIVSPGADPNAITLNFAGADGVEIDPRGDLVLHTAAGDVVQQKPFTYQEAGQTRREVTSRYVVDGTRVNFEVGAYDATRPLVIDPLVMGYSTYLGGAPADDLGYGIAVNGAGNAYVTGRTNSTNFPITPGAFDTTHNGNTDAFVAKLSSDGSTLAYGTYLGGLLFEEGNGIALDAAGNAYVTGFTTSTDFPTTPGAFDTTLGGQDDGFVAKLSSDGTTLAYGTYLDGSGSGFGIDVDAAGNAYVTGITGSASFPTTPGAFDTTYNGGGDGFAVKLSGDGSTLAYSTYLGGSGYDSGVDIAVDGAGNAYVTGWTRSVNFPTIPGAFNTKSSGSFDAFVAKLSGDGSTLAYGTYLGGSKIDIGWSIAVDGAGNAYVTGYTGSTDFPTTPRAFDATFNGRAYDAFVTKLSGDGSTLTYGTYLGGSNGDRGFGIAVDGAGNAYVTGATGSVDFPTTPGAFDTMYNVNEDAFVAKLSGDGNTLVYGTYVGGFSIETGFGIAVDAAGNAYLAGYTGSSNFPTTPGALKQRYLGVYDAFVTKFAEV